MKKKILITTAMERTSRILLRTELFELLKQEYDIIVASPAELSPQWREEFKDITFFSDLMQKGDAKNIKDIMERGNISAIVACGNSDVPAHTFDVNFQKMGRALGIPIIIIQDFIDSIFHPMPITPDLYLCWGDFFKRMYSRKRDVMIWHPIGSLHGLSVEEALPNVVVTGPCHFDIYRKSEYYNREKFCLEIGFDIKKPIFTYLPNGEISQWVFDTFDNFMETAKEFGAQVIIKAHPIRTGDSWIYNLIIKKYPTVDVKIIADPSLNKGTAYGVKEYEGHSYHLDNFDTWALGNLLFNSDICCSIPSTSALEALIFNKPVVLENMYWSHPYEVRKNVMNWYWNVLDSYKCVNRSKKYGELFNYIEENLKNPNKNMEGRANIVKDFFNGVQGNSCVLTFEAIKNFLEGDLNTEEELKNLYEDPISME